MKSTTTKPNEHGWYYTFRVRNDKTIIIKQMNKDCHLNEGEIHIYGKKELEVFYKIIKEANK